MTARVPDLMVERLALGELEASEAQRVRAALEAAGELERLEAIDRSNGEILASHPPSEVRAEVERRAESSGGSSAEPPARRVARFAVPLAAAAAAALVWLALPRRPGPEGGGHGIEAGADGGLDGGLRIKGDPRLLVYRRTEGGTQLLRAGDQAAAGTLLQVGYQANGAASGVIVSIDGRGSVTLHHPASPDADPELREGGRVTLPESFELDDAPEFERFILVAGDQGEVDVTGVLEAARELAADPERRRDGALELEGDWVQRSLLVEKRSTADPIRAGE